MRKLVTIQEITDIHPIKDADRIEVAKVLGWNVVVGKGQFSIGDKVVFFELTLFCRTRIQNLNSSKLVRRRALSLTEKRLRVMSSQQ